MNKNWHLKYFSGILFIYFIAECNIVFSQPADNGLWTSIQVEKEFSKRWSVSLEEELRLKENYSQVDRLFTELVASYKLIPGFKVSLGYRFSEKVDFEKYFANDLRFEHRWLGEIQYKYKYKLFTFFYKTRIESEMKYIYSSERGKVAGWGWKNKLEVKYRLTRYEPYAGVELRYQFTDPRHPESNFMLNRIWIYAGVDFSIIKNHTLGVYYLFQKEWNLTDAKKYYILGVKYSIFLHTGKKKSQKS
jgi:hypothetical protein